MPRDEIQRVVDGVQEIHRLLTVVTQRGVSPEKLAMSGSYLAQWIASISTGHVITEEDMATLARIRLALDKADQHHRQARAAQAVLSALREPSEAVLEAAEPAMFCSFDSHKDIVWLLQTAVAAAEQEANDGQP